MRTCIVCGGKHTKDKMFRLVYDGAPTADLLQRADGRGRYVCSDARCCQKLADGRILCRSFRVRSIPAGDISSLAAALNAALERDFSGAV